jgi:hypothetical protein
MPRSRAPKLRKSGLGDRLARKGYSFEIVVRGELGACPPPACCIALCGGLHTRHRCVPALAWDPVVCSSGRVKPAFKAGRPTLVPLPLSLPAGPAG